MTRYGTDGETGKVDSYPQPLHEWDIYIVVKMKPEDWHLRPECRRMKRSSYETRNDRVGEADVPRIDGYG